MVIVMAMWMMMSAGRPGEVWGKYGANGGKLAWFWHRSYLCGPTVSPTHGRLAIKGNDHEIDGVVNDHFVRKRDVTSKEWRRDDPERLKKESQGQTERSGPIANHCSPAPGNFVSSWMDLSSFCQSRRSILLRTRVVVRAKESVNTVIAAPVSPW